MAVLEIPNDTDFAKNTIIMEYAYTCPIRQRKKMTIPKELSANFDLQPGMFIYFATISNNLFLHFKTPIPGMSRQHMTKRRIQWEGGNPNKTLFVRLPPLILKELTNAACLQLIHPQNMEPNLWKIILYSKSQIHSDDF